MSQAVNMTENGGTVLPATDCDILFFLQRTLQFHSSDPQKADVFAKLQNLKDALDQQEATLASWPDSPSKDRICASLTKAKKSIADIVDSFGGDEPTGSAATDVDAA